MKYQILSSGRGVIIDPSPIFRDIKDTHKVSFLFPGMGAWIAVFVGAGGIRYPRQIKDGQCKVPPELLKKEQTVELSVCRMDGEQIIDVHQCESLQVVSFYHSARHVIGLAPVNIDAEALKRLADLEEQQAVEQAQIAALTECVERLESENAELRAKVESKPKRRFI